jgi:hypothetical protein
MDPTLKTGACRMIGLVAAVILASAAVPTTFAREAMPFAQQDALVQKYCVVCHNGARLIGGMSLEHFDPAHPDPSIAGMMVSKLRYGAMGAAGIPMPDSATISALIDALSEKAIGAEATTGGWEIESNASPLPPPPPPTITASIQQRAESARNAKQSTVYRLTLTCVKTPDTSNAAIASASHLPEMRLTADRPPPAGGSVALIFDVDGTAGGSPIVHPNQQNSEGAAFVMPLPSRTLTIRNFFPGESVTFPFDGLNPGLRRILSTCLPSDTAQ